MKKRYLILGIAGAVGVTASIALFSAMNSMADDIVYRDVVVEYGTVTMGHTESAFASVGIIEQYFDMDISVLADVEPEMQELQVEKVLASAGQQVRKGTPLLRVTADSVKQVRTTLQKEILDSNKDYELLKARQKELRLQASQGYDNDIVSGRYAGMIYSDKCDVLREKVKEAKEAVDHKQAQVNENLLELTQTQQELVEAQEYLREAEIAVSENYKNRHDNAYYYTVYENTRETAQNMVARLEEEIASLTKKNESLLYEVDEATRAYHQTVLEQEKANLTAKKDYDTEIYRAETASEQYDIQMVCLDNALQEARERYESALHKIRVFDAYIVRDNVLSEYDGVIAEICVAAGESMAKNDKIAAFYDTEAREMLYVPYGAVFQEEGRSYVKVRQENGDIVEKSVTTGSTDGIYTEIVNGLSEGDVVLEAVY